MLFKKQKYDEPTIAWREARHEHKVAIKQLRRDIRKHKMLRKQARLQYKITK